MATRKIIRIDEELCNGCGDCVVGCAEGALQIIDGKAKLVREDFCDGFGDCVGTCPTGALTIEDREEAPDYDPEAARAHVGRTRGAEGLAAFDKAAQQHEPELTGGCPGSKISSASRRRVLPIASDGVSPSSPNPSLAQGAPAFSAPSPSNPAPAGGGCPGSRAQAFEMANAAPTGSSAPSTAAGNDPGTIQPSQLGQWPLMLHLVPPRAPFFKNKELCLLSTCSPAAMPDAQWRFVRGRSLAMACPKLDRTDGYLEKLAEIMREPSIPRVLVVRMEVPCCSGLTKLAVSAARNSGREDLQVVEATVSIRGEFLGESVVWGG